MIREAVAQCRADNGAVVCDENAFAVRHAASLTIAQNLGHTHYPVLRENRLADNLSTVVRLPWKIMKL